MNKEDFDEVENGVEMNSPEPKRNNPHDLFSSDKDDKESELKQAYSTGEGVGTERRLACLTPKTSTLKLMKMEVESGPAGDESDS